MLISSLVCLFACSVLRADEVELKDGNKLSGTYRGGTESSVSFEVYGNVMQLPTTNIVKITFATTAPASAAAPAPAAPAPQAAASGAVTLPAGTLLLVRLGGTISTKNTKTGASFSTKLEYDLIVDGVTVVKAGTTLYGKVHEATQAKRARGQSTLDLRLVQISTKAGQVPIATSAYQQAGANSIRKVAKGAAAGAIIGNNTGSGDEGEGAAIGAGVAALKPGDPIVVPAGTLLEFSLEQPATVTVSP